jgi:nucleotide-binding universal stress UspA family protein
MIVCVDGSDLSIDAARAGLALLRAASRTIVATVVPELDEMAVTGTGIAGGVMSAEEAEAQLRRQEREGGLILDDAVAALDLDGAETSILHGDPGPSLCAAAEDVGADALVLGSRGRGAVKRALLGSVSDYVARHAPCPVVITRTN